MKATDTLSKKVSARLTEKQYKIILKNAKASKLSIADYIRACIL
jgi:uncharacterized protein (DUF1778 family)